MVQLLPNPPIVGTGLARVQIAQNHTGRTSTAAPAEEVHSELELTKRSLGNPRVVNIWQTVFVEATLSRALASFVGIELGSTVDESIAADAPG